MLMYARMTGAFSALGKTMVIRSGMGLIALN